MELLCFLRVSQRFRFAGAFILLVTSLTVAAQPGPVIREINHAEIPAGTGTTLIRNVTIIDGNGGPPVAGGSVLVRNGIIAEIGKTGELHSPKGAEIMEGTGLYLLPGFIDAHFHLDGVSGLPGLFLQNGVTSVRDPGAWIEMYDGERKSDKLLPRLFLADPHLDMFPPAYPRDTYVVRDAEEAVNQVHRMADRGASVIKVYFRLPAGIIRAVCEAAHSRGLPVTGHLEITEAREAIEAGLDGIEHITSFGLTLAPPLQAEKYRQMVLADNNARKQGRYEVWQKIGLQSPLVDSLSRFLVRKGTFVTPTLGAFEYQTKAGQVTDSSKLGGFEKMKMLTGALSRAGVQIVVGSHAMIPYAEKGWAYQREMELLVASGMAPSQVIKAATVENARFFRIDKRLGSIEKGKIADLILIRGNPLDDISNTRNIVKVMLHGTWVRE